MKNMGAIDRLIRVTLAVIMATLYAAGIISGVIGIILFVLSIIFILTSSVSICPLYWPFGLNTMQKNYRTKVD